MTPTHPSWHHCPFPEQVHPAAHAAFAHDSGAHLVKLWYASEEIAGLGTWWIYLVVKGRRVRPYSGGDFNFVFATAEGEIEQGAWFV